jgi:hypothetical protein
MQDFWPFVQLSWQPSMHAALGAMPEHVLGASHVAVVTAKQPSPSFVQVATVWASLQTVPFWVHTVDLHLQAATPSVPTAQS